MAVAGHDQRQEVKDGIVVVLRVLSIGGVIHVGVLVHV